MLECPHVGIAKEHVLETNASISSDTMPPALPRTKRSQIWPLVLTWKLYHGTVKK